MFIKPHNTHPKRDGFSFSIQIGDRVFIADEKFETREEAQEYMPLAIKEMHAELSSTLFNILEYPAIKVFTGWISNKQHLSIIYDKDAPDWGAYRKDGIIYVGKSVSDIVVAVLRAQV